MKKWMLLLIPIIILLVFLVMILKPAEEIPNTSDTENMETTTLPAEETKNTDTDAFEGEELPNLELDNEPNSNPDDQNETENTPEETVSETKQSGTGGIREGSGGSDMVHPPENGSEEEY